ncbi:MBL fold metallo-hydrolase [Sphingomonas montana]|uniref:MBL fold metallo-hydrolase n=1 Tax=Sphingomonas montana TaxID=1843236 RepID=UPI00096FE901|nr:MBL fold metallo-hydrolase [Sphingomonas montana]
MIRSKAFALFALAIASPLAIAAAAVPVTMSDTVPGAVRQTTPATYRFTIGDATVTALSDGTVPLDLHQMLRGAPAKTIDELLTRSFLSNPAEAPINAYLIDFNGRRILVDVGAGDLFGAGNAGRMLDALAAAGAAPDTITDILITHVHSDHSGGLTKAGKIVFPRATVHVGGADVRFFSDATNATRTGIDKHYWTETEQTLKPYVTAGQVKTFDTDRDILPGIRAELHPGHTPGTAFFTLTSKGQSIVFVGDVIHSGAVQFPRPDVTITYDVRQDEARIARQAAFRRFARDRALIAAPHLPFPGVGHISADGSGYRWYPIEHKDRAPAVDKPKP